MKKLFKAALLLFFVFQLFSTANSQQKYAVIITGDYAANKGSWYVNNDRDSTAKEAFWNDTYLMWEMLLEKGYTNENIFVLFADSSDYQPDWMYKRYIPQIWHHEVIPSPNGKITDYSATKENVEMVLTGLADGSNGFPQLTQDDFLYVYTFGHGYHAVTEPGGTEIARTFLCLMDYNWDVPDTEWDSIHSITDIELANLLGNISAHKKVVVMQQCYSIKSL